MGIAGRGPGCDNVDEFWDLIMSQQDLYSEIPKDRFDVDEYYCPAHEKGDKRCTMSTRYGCFMSNPGHFDSRFYHISPREALLMDPNHRQFLTSTYEALESAGYSDARSRATDPNRIAAYFAQATDDWHKHSHGSLGCDSYTLQGIQRAFGAGRLAWQFKWEGPTYALDSACAGTTAGIHLACQSLQAKDIDIAVAGAANILSWPHFFTCLSDSGILSDTGNCKTFRDDADGYCRGDYVGAVVLKRLENAVQHNDNVLAVIASSGRNHSGNSTSITSSDAGAQERLFRKILRNAQVGPNDIGYVEMHGTGTQTGDPAEMGAVANMFRNRNRTLGPVPIGGVKANVGHGEAAAGMAELLKSIKMFQENTIPPQAHMPHALNPNFPPLRELNLEIPSASRVFSRASPDVPRRILLNNFDAAGGNSCMLMEDYVAPHDSNRSTFDPRSAHVVTVSARTKAALEGNKRHLVEWLKPNPDPGLHNTAYTTTARRMQHPLRLAYATSSTADLIKKLQSTEAPPASSSKVDVVFVFTEQGSHYAGMGAELYRTSHIFRETVDLCAATCKETEFPAFADIIHDDNVDIESKNTAQIQLAIVTLEIALVAFWRAADLQPRMVIGHSLGEYAALHTAGVLSLTDTLYLVGTRAVLLLERCEAGSCAMLVLSTSEANVRRYTEGRPDSSCEIACLNGPDATVVSGTIEDLSQLQADISKQNLKTRGTMLSVPYAFHSFQMDNILEDYTTAASGVNYSPPKIPIASTLLGTVIEEHTVVNQNYLAQQARRPVNFVAGLDAVQSKSNDSVWLEIGPRPICASFIRTTLSPTSSKVISTLDGAESD